MTPPRPPPPPINPSPWLLIITASAPVINGPRRGKSWLYANEWAESIPGIEAHGWVAGWREGCGIESIRSMSPIHESSRRIEDAVHQDESKWIQNRPISDPKIANFLSKIQKSKN